MTTSTLHRIEDLQYTPEEIESLGAELMRIGSILRMHKSLATAFPNGSSIPALLFIEALRISCFPFCPQPDLGRTENLKTLPSPPDPVFTGDHETSLSISYHRSPQRLDTPLTVSMTFTEIPF